MAYENKKMLYYGATGVFVAILLISTTLSSPAILNYLFPSETAKTGMLRVMVTDAPVPDLKNLNLTINQVMICNKNGSWITLEMTNEIAYFDLLKLNNVTKELAINEIPVGNYTKIRMQIVSANATLADGTVFTLNVPSGHMDIHIFFEIEPGKTTTLIIDIIVDKVNIAERGSSGNPPNLNPQFKPIVISP